MLVNFYQTGWCLIPEDSIVIWWLKVRTVEQEVVNNRQWNSKHISVATNTDATTEDDVFYVATARQQHSEYVSTVMD